jgi:hypothetical protein
MKSKKMPLLKRLKEPVSMHDNFSNTSVPEERKKEKTVFFLLW